MAGDRDHSGLANADEAADASRPTTHWASHPHTADQLHDDGLAAPESDRASQDGDADGTSAWDGADGRHAAGLLPSDDSGYRVQPRDCEFLDISPEQVEAWANREAPLGMTPAEFREFGNSLFEALRRDGFAPDEIDVRLQGSSARFFSGEHKSLPLHTELPEHSAARVRMEDWFGEDSNRPLRRPFDSMFRLGLEDEPSDYDIQLSSDSMADTCRREWEARGSHGPLTHTKYNFIVKEIFEDIFPALWEWADVWTERTGRPVVPSLFYGEGPPNTSARGVSSHFRTSDWIIHPEGNSAQ